MSLAPRILLFLAALTLACGGPDKPTKQQQPPPPGGTTVTGDSRGGDTQRGDRAVGGDTRSVGDIRVAGDTRVGDGNTGDALVGDSNMGDATPCAQPLGHSCNPIPITAFPFVDTGDTSMSTSDTIDTYDCAPATSEAGPEVFYVVTLTEPGLLTASINEITGDGIDVDVHIVSALDGTGCLARNNEGTGVRLDPGTYYIVTDTWSNGMGTEYPGPYTLTVNFYGIGSGICALQSSDVKMFWPTCDASLDCYEAWDNTAMVNRRYLRTPAYGPLVREAHLVTVDDGFGGGWPATINDQIANHHTVSEAASCYATTRSNEWAPMESSEFGQGATGAYLPTLAEAWYVNMYWRDRPAPGARMLVVNPLNGLAVVAAGGYETGPGSNTAIGGAADEIHSYLGTDHRDLLMMGFLVDQTLPFGPIDCAVGPIDLCP